MKYLNNRISVVLLNIQITGSLWFSEYSLWNTSETGAPRFFENSNNRTMLVCSTRKERLKQEQEQEGSNNHPWISVQPNCVRRRKEFFFLINIIFKNSQLWMELWSRSRIRNLPHKQREFAFCLALAQVAGDEMNLGGEQDSSCAQKIVTGLSRIPQEGFSRVLLVAVSENGSRKMGNQKE